ncbi:hypothetical protein SAE02_77730 [Skermanella aerolata]|uniref:Uncharacterized protein n=1 Tax=Skermanella aerolata TaxID=393310 RepID=A0A512E4G8_9PROT|nr:hypothetical protein [Skermanella aerolata]KJB90846.1 hypothetical protein N826_34200 [Skermanella aerolata KACC 11604]GEO43625.1 hypothetical protein SAE02_77730 [Skermanella aerolata]
MAQVDQQVIPTYALVGFASTGGAPDAGEESRDLAPHRLSLAGQRSEDAQHQVAASPVRVAA